MVESEEGRRVYLEVRETGPVVSALSADGAGLFVPTRLPLSLGDVFILAIRLRNVSRSVELPMLVHGRRLPRNGSILSGGVVAKLADPASPMFELLAEVAGGRVIDLEARIQERQRIPVKSRFTSSSEAEQELRALLEGPAQLPVDDLVTRGDRLAMTIVCDGVAPLLTMHTIVKSVAMLDGRRSATVELLDKQARTTVEQYLENDGRRTAKLRPRRVK